MARILRNLQIREISSVDKGAGEGVRVVLMKRHNESHGHSSRLRKTFTRALRKARSEYDEEMSSPGFSRDPARTGPTDADEDAGAAERRNEDRYEGREEHEQEGDIIATSVMPPKLHQMVAAIRTAAPNVSEQEVVHFLLHTASGRSVAEHLSNHMISKSKDHRPMSLQALAKRDGVETIAKALLAKGNAMEISEFEYTELMKAEAVRKGQSFEAYFTDPANIEIRKAWALTKSTLVPKDSLMRPVEVTPVTIETGRTDTASDAEAAYSELMSMAEELAASGEYRSVASAFAAVFSDQKNAELAARAHKRPNAAHV
jgi:hypothetical protein